MRAALPHFVTALGETRQAQSAMSEQAITLEGSWTGDAAVPFSRALNEWLENCKIVEQQLNIVYEKLEQQTGTYQQVHANTHDAATELQNAMAAGLPGF